MRKLKTKVDLFKLKLQCLTLKGKNVDYLEPEDEDVKEFLKINSWDQI